MYVSDDESTYILSVSVAVKWLDMMNICADCSAPGKIPIPIPQVYLHI